MKHSYHALLRLLERDRQACGIRKKNKEKKKCMHACLLIGVSFINPTYFIVYTSSIRPTILTRLNLQIKKMNAIEEFLQEPIPLSNELIG